MERKKCYAGYYTSIEFKEKIEENRGVILICGSCEQHGHHLPLDTDNIIGMEIALRIAEETDMLVMPPLNYGQVWSAKGFPGTLSLTADVLKMVLKELIYSLEEQKVKNIVLMSGHNGNYPFLKETARELLDEKGWENIWHFPISFSKEVLNKAKSPAAMVPHAGEVETAMLLYLRPELVCLEQATQEFPTPPAEYAFRPMHWNSFVKTGSFGDGGAASAEFGKILVEDVVNTTIRRIHEFL